ncbi:Protein kinase kin1, partial [Coemansia erecta]
MLGSDDNNQLRSRLEFSINLDMLDTKPAVEPPELQIKPRERRRTLRKMLPSRTRTGTLRIHRHSRSIRRTPRTHAPSRDQQCDVDKSTGFQLQQLKLPSPITSFSPDLLWSGPLGNPGDDRDKANANNIDDDDDDVALAELMVTDPARKPSFAIDFDQTVRPASPLGGSNVVKSSLGASNEIKNPSRNPSLIKKTSGVSSLNEKGSPTASLTRIHHPSPTASLTRSHHPSPTTSLDTSLHPLQPAGRTRNLRPSLSASQKSLHKQSDEPRRGRSLMFKPVLDVTAVGTLIDTISKNKTEPAPQPRSQQSERPSRILGSLRRVTRTRTAGKLLRRSQRVRSTVASGRATRPRSHDICPIETVQDEQSQQQQPLPGFQAALAMSAVGRPSETTTNDREEDDDMRGYVPIAMSLQGARTRQFLLNTPLGEFEVERTLGQGSYGKVKLMRSALSHEQYAVKIIRRHARRNDAKKAATLDRRVVREANLAAMLGQLHPHIVPLYDLRATDTHFYLFYAAVQGATLADRVGSSGMDERSAARVFKSVCETVQFCHQFSVIHRDIKLENVLLDANDHAMLIDFGLANFYGAAPMETFCGSLPYTAPEILRGTAYVGPEVDAWSLGVLLYVMLTGRFPFDDPAQPANFERIMAGDFPLRGSLSREVQELLVRMLEPDSVRRITVPQVLAHAWLVKQHVPEPGVCCVDHCALPVAVHSRRSLVIPGPRASRLLAREVATCLDRPLDDVIAHIDRALARGTPAPNAAPPHNSTWSLLAPIETWPAPLHGLGGGPLIEVSNSPIVSVYALVLQQIGMRRYYLDLPPLEPGLAATTRSSSSRLAPSQLQSHNHIRSQPRRDTDVSDNAAEPRSLAARLAAQLTGLVSLGTGAGAAQGDKPRRGTGPMQGDKPRRGHLGEPPKPGLLSALHDNNLVEPSYVQPLSTGPCTKPDPPLRTIGALEHLHERITLPHALSALPALHVLAQLSALLNMHQITHTFVKTQKMPAHRAMLNSSMFSLKTMAALASSTDALASKAPTSPATRSSLKSLLSVFNT